MNRLDDFRPLKPLALMVLFCWALVALAVAGTYGAGWLWRILR